MVNSRRKGNVAERAVINILKEYWPGKWERRSMGIPGADIIAPPEFPYAVEVKHVKELRLKHLFQPTALLRSFVEQATEQARELGKRPLLCAKIEGLWFAITLHPGAYSYHNVMLLHEWCKKVKGENNGNGNALAGKMVAGNKTATL